MKFFSPVLTVVTCVVLSSTFAAAEVAVPAESLTSLVSSALANNPELKSSEARWQMFVGKAKQSASLDDPMLMLKMQNVPFRYPLLFNKDTASARVIGISQQIPFWGKRAIREEVARHEAESYRWSIEERRLELTRMVSEAWYQLWALDRNLEIVDKNLKILADFVTIAESKYSVGQGVQQDIFKANLEKSKMLDMQIKLLQQRKSLEANLDYLLYRPATRTVGRVAAITDLPELSLSAEQLHQKAFENRPQFKSLSSLTSKGEAAQRLAQKEFYPDFNVSFEYMNRDQVSTTMETDPGFDMFSLGITFNLPFQRERRNAMLAESASATSMANEELNSLKNSITFAINDGIAQLERRKKLVELYRGGIIPQAEQSLESAVISYRVGKVDFMTLLDSQMTLLNYERELYESQAEYMMGLARLEAAVGIKLTN